MVATGFALPHNGFDPNLPHTCCRICGEVFQHLETEIRREWSFAHARKHTTKQHTALAASGRWCTPEAAKKLAPYGIISLVDLVMDEEMAAAYAEAPSTINT